MLISIISQATNVALQAVISGAYLEGGALGHGPPLCVARIAKLHRKVSKIEACPPPFASWASGSELEIT